MKRRFFSLLIAFAIITSSSFFGLTQIEAQATYVDEFLQTVGPMCTEDMRTNRILASFTLAQAIYESGWGRSTLAVEANNLFGMRAYSSWTGKVYDRNQGVLYNSWDEMVSKKGSYYVKTYAMSFWRAFDSWAECVNSHSELFNTSTRYSNLRGNYDYKSCCRLVVEDGYCTDSGYTENLIGLIESYNLEQYNYDFEANGEDGSVPEADDGVPEGKNLLEGVGADYYLKGKWTEFSGSTSLPTDSAYRGDGKHAFSGNSAVSGVTFDTADYNSTNATVNYFVFELEEAVDIAYISIRGYREDGNRNYLTLEAYAGTEAISVNSENCETVTEGMTRLDYSMERTVIKDAPQSAGVDQFFNLTLSFSAVADVNSILIKTNLACASGGFFQFDEIEAYAPEVPFTFTEGADRASVTADVEKGVLTLNGGVMTAEAIEALFADPDISITDTNGAAAASDRTVSTGWVISSNINGKVTSLTLVVHGDINGDAVISSADYMMLCAYIKSAVVLDTASTAACDLDGSENVSSADYMLLRQAIN